MPMYTRIHCKVCMVNFEPRAIEKSYKKKHAHAHMHMHGLARGVAVPRVLRTPFGSWTASWFQEASRWPKLASRWPQDGLKMTPRWVVRRSWRWLSIDDVVQK